jgi:hypothetical protein
LDPYKEFIIAQMERGIINAERMCRDLQQRGYAGKVRIVRAFMQPLRPLAEAKASVRFETEPGHQAQVDWADFGHIEVNGVLHRLYCFVMVLAYSRALYLEFTTSTDIGTFIRCHINALRFFGGMSRGGRCSIQGLRTSQSALASGFVPASHTSPGRRGKWNGRFSTFGPPSSKGGKRCPWLTSTARRPTGEIP